MLKTLLIVLGLSAAGLAATPALAQTAAQPGATLQLPHRSDVTGTARRRAMHRSTLNRQRARATSAHARHLRGTSNR
jgi:hypothetical protein